jgi:hypothetical protein
MASVRFTDVQARPTEFLDWTSLTLDEFQLLVPPFEAAFQAHMREWRLDGKPRTARRFTVYKHYPLPTPEDRLFFILTYLSVIAIYPLWRALAAACPQRVSGALSHRASAPRKRQRHPVSVDRPSRAEQGANPVPRTLRRST